MSSGKGWSVTQIPVTPPLMSRYEVRGASFTRAGDGDHFS
ncbi:unnamed protein product [[Actinomadura] parvosata subsp. kistnae]|nr:unnamed protein product [Actinomadura parvosata subsp. kistnae]